MSKTRLEEFDNSIYNIKNADNYDFKIQKGITNIYKENQYKKYYQLEESNTKKEENEENSLLSPINDNNLD